MNTDMQLDTQKPKRPKKPEAAATVTARGAALKERRRAMGLERIELWVRPEHKAKIKDLAQALLGDFF